MSQSHEVISKAPISEQSADTIQTQISKLTDQLKPYTFTIGIDGSAAAGKGALTEKLAKDLDLRRIETGHMYRAVTFFLQEIHGIHHPDQELTDEALTSLLQKMEIHTNLDPFGDQHTILEYTKENGTDTIDITYQLETPKISTMVSDVAKRIEVRTFLAKQQVALLMQGDTIIEGRDTWYIAPYPTTDALVYLDASDETLIKREMKRQEKHGIKITKEQAEELTVVRNEKDRTRTQRPLLTRQEAKISGLYDAVIDTTHLTVDETELQVLQLLATLPHKRLKQPSNPSSIHHASAL